MWSGVIVAGLFLSTLRGMSQIRVDTARGLVGKEIDLPLSYNGEENLDSGRVISLVSDFQLTRPTVFYPQAFRPGASLTILDSVLERFTDSTWSFTLSLQVERTLRKGDTLALLAGEALAGTDSTTLLLFTNVRIDDQPVPDMTGTIIAESIGTRLPYVRFALLDPGRPNPATTGETVRWGFRIDKESEVYFKIYDILGREVSVKDFGVLQKGVYINTFTPDITIPNGVFVVRLITNSGEATQVMHVVK